MPKIVDHKEQRLQLSATVAEVVADAGLEHTTLRTVAARHGCTKGMVQHYFSDKDELLLAAINFVEDESAARIAAAARGLSGLEELQARLVAQLPLDSALQDEWRARLAFITLAAQMPAISDVLKESQAQQQAQGLRLLRQAQRSGSLRSGLSPLNCYRALTLLVYGLGVATVTGGGQWSPSVQKQLLKSAIHDLRS